MQRACILAALVAFAGVGCGGGGGGAPQDLGTLEVLVEDATGAALPDAVVTTAPATQQLTTGADGRAVLARVEPGTYLLGAARAGHLPATIQVTVAKGTASLTVKLVASEALVAWYPFDGSADDAAGGHHATAVSATPCPDRFGRADLAYAFDGATDLITLPPLLTAATNHLTAAAWVRPEVVDRQLVVLSVQDHSGFDMGVHYGTVYWFIMTGPGSGLSAGSDPVVTAGEWQHVAFTRDGGVLRTYHQGTLVGEVDAGDEQVGPGTGSTNTIGGFTTDQPVRFQGALEDVQVFTRALSAEEVAALAQR